MARREHQFNKFGFPEGTKNGNKGRKEILQLNQNLRNLDEPLGHLPWGSVMLQIPELDYYVLLRRYPELNSPDPEIRTRAFDKFAQSSESAPYRVRANRNAF